MLSFLSDGDQKRIKEPTVVTPNWEIEDVRDSRNCPHSHIGSSGEQDTESVVHEGRFDLIEKVMENLLTYSTRRELTTDTDNVLE